MAFRELLCTTGIPLEDEVIILGDLNGHVGRDGHVWREVHGGHGLGVENNEGVKI